MRVKWLKEAVRSLTAQTEYIAEDNAAAAARVETHIKNAVSLLAKYPAIGRAGRVVGTRELVITNLPYVVVYRVRQARVEILRVHHTARKWPQTV